MLSRHIKFENIQFYQNVQLLYSPDLRLLEGIFLKRVCLLGYSFFSKILQICRKYIMNRNLILYIMFVKNLISLYQFRRKYFSNPMKHFSQDYHQLYWIDLFLNLDLCKKSLMPCLIGLILILCKKSVLPYFDWLNPNLREISVLIHNAYIKHLCF